MSWIADHLLLSALAPLVLVAVVCVGVFVARFYRRPPAVAHVESEPERTVVDDLHDLDHAPDEPEPEQAAPPVAVEPQGPTWMDTVRASTPTTPLEVRPVEIDDYDAHQDAEVIRDSGWSAWFQGNAQPTRTDRRPRAIGAASLPPLPIETTVPAWIGWDVEADHGDPDEGHTGLTGAFRWGPDGTLIPVSQLLAELRTDDSHRGRS